jgi:hypothetical protein
MLRFVLGSVIAAAWTVAASAQTIVIKPDEHGAPSPVEQVRISIAVNLFALSSDGNNDQALKVQEDARRAIYDLAGHECALLRDVLASDCHLESVNVNVQRVGPQNFGQQRSEGFNINGNIGFRVVPK